MSSERKTVFTKENLDTYLKEVAKEYRKLCGKSMPAELILIGGASILANYGFREMTTDVDAIIRAASSMKDAANRVGDKFDLPNGWLNADFQRTDSYTAKLEQYAAKAIYKNVLGKTQAEVKEKLKKAIEETKGLDIAKAESYTVGQWMDVWYEYYAKIKVRVSSHKTYEGYIKNHIKPNIGNIPLTKLTTLDLQMMYQKLLTGGRVDRLESQHQPKGLSAKTVRNLNQIISSAMKLAMEQKLIAHNPADGCALPRVEHREMKTLPAEQLAAFLHEAKKTGVYEMYYLDLATGMRRGELLGLKWEDIETIP